jgi:outer membrane lipoprotein-sorting protein
MAANTILLRSIYLKESSMQATPRSTLFALSLILAFSLQAKEAAPATAAKMDVDQIIAKYQEARGGADKWAAAKTMRFAGKMAMGPMEAPISMEFKRPKMMRMEFVIQGMTGIQGFDGTNGWAVMPFMGKTDAEPLSDEDLKQVKDQADIDGPLIDYKAKGHKVELLGQEDVEGTKAYKLKVVKANGDEEVDYIDADYFLVIKQDSKTIMKGQPVEMTTTLGDYKDVSGLLIPHSIKNETKGGSPMPGSQTITLEKVEINPVIADARFTMPPKKAPDVAPAADAAKKDGQ